MDLTAWNQKYSSLDKLSQLGCEILSRFSYIGKDYIRGQERFIGPKNDNDTDTVERVEGWEAKVLLQL